MPEWRPWRDEQMKRTEGWARRLNWRAKHRHGDVTQLTGKELRKVLRQVSWRRAL